MRLPAYRQLGDLRSITELAQIDGCVCFTPRDDELLIDMDYNHEIDTEATKGILSSRGLTFLSTLKTVSKGGNTHLYIKLDRGISQLERICIQLLLGSDPLRESYSLAKYWIGSDAVTVLFERPSQAKKVEEWRERC